MTGASDLTGSMEAVGLDELVQTASLLSRVDRKYVVERSVLASVLQSLMEIPAAPRALEMAGLRTFRYESEYSDTSDLASYYLAAYQRRHRFKLRYRTYQESGLSFLEVKTRSANGLTIKQRMPRESSTVRELSDRERSFLLGVREVAPHVSNLHQVLTTTYERTTLLLADGSRTTIDQGLQATHASGRGLRLDRVIVETKTRGPICAMDRALRDHSIMAVPFSKYTTSLAALFAELPANRWSRTLRRHFTDERRLATSPASLLR